MSVVGRAVRAEIYFDDQADRVETELTLIPSREAAMLGLISVASVVLRFAASHVFPVQIEAQDNRPDYFTHRAIPASIYI